MFFIDAVVIFMWWQVLLGNTVVVVMWWQISLFYVILLVWG